MTSKRTWTVPATVVRVIDGDTIVLVLDLGWRVTMEASCRLVGVNCPEMNTPEGVAARDFTLGAIAGAPLTFVSHALDKYGRPLGEILVGDRSLNQALLDAGHAVVMKG